MSGNVNVTLGLRPGLNLKPSSDGDRKKVSPAFEFGGEIGVQAYPVGNIDTLQFGLDVKVAGLMDFTPVLLTAGLKELNRPQYITHDSAAAFAAETAAGISLRTRFAKTHILTLSAGAYGRIATGEFTPGNSDQEAIRVTNLDYGPQGSLQYDYNPSRVLGLFVKIGSQLPMGKNSLTEGRTTANGESHVESDLSGIPKVRLNLAAGFAWSL